MTPAARRRPRRGLVVTVTDGRGRPMRARGLRAFLAAAAPPGTAGQVTIALVGDATMRRLNRQFLGHDYPTDVLSFPQSAWQVAKGGAGLSPPLAGPADHLRQGSGGRPKPRAKAEAGPSDRSKPLGEMAIALGVAARQAGQEGHSLHVELRILALHGLLHLLGYDHDTDQGEMGRLEERLRRRAGLPVGLIARAPGRPRRR